jgi:hypothetical protein
MDEACTRCGRVNVDLSPEAVAALADQIPVAPELKADEELFNVRLSACSACDALREGVLCAHCGCFIRFRARVGKQYCPHPAGDKWIAV